MCFYRQDGASCWQTILVCLLPLVLQSREEVRSPSGTQKFVVLNHRGHSDACRRQRLLDAYDPGDKAYSHGVSKRYMWGKGKGDFKLRARGNIVVEVKEDAPRADILRLREKLVAALELNDGRQAHVKAPHQAPFLSIRLHGQNPCPLRTASSVETAATTKA